MKVEVNTELKGLCLLYHKLLYVYNLNEVILGCRVLEIIS